MTRKRPNVVIAGPALLAALAGETFTPSTSNVTDQRDERGAILHSTFSPVRDVEVYKKYKHMLIDVVTAARDRGAAVDRQRLSLLLRVCASLHRRRKMIAPETLLSDDAINKTVASLPTTSKADYRARLRRLADDFAYKEESETFARRRATRPDTIAHRTALFDAADNLSNQRHRRDVTLLLHATYHCGLSTEEAAVLRERDVTLLPDGGVAINASGRPYPAFATNAAGQAIRQALSGDPDAYLIWQKTTHRGSLASRLVEYAARNDAFLKTFHAPAAINRYRYDVLKSTRIAEAAAACGLTDTNTFMHDMLLFLNPPALSEVRSLVGEVA